jgi:hypothetical protein
VHEEDGQKQPPRYAAPAALDSEASLIVAPRVQARVEKVEELRSRAVELL